MVRSNLEARHAFFSGSTFVINAKNFKVIRSAAHLNDNSVEKTYEYKFLYTKCLPGDFRIKIEYSTLTYKITYKILIVLDRFRVFLNINLKTK